MFGPRPIAGRVDDRFYEMENDLPYLVRTGVHRNSIGSRSPRSNEVPDRVENVQFDDEKGVQRAIETMDRDYAVVAIAHRPSTVKNADRVYTLGDRRITEFGTPEGSKTGNVR